MIDFIKYDTSKRKKDEIQSGHKKQITHEN